MAISNMDDIPDINVSDLVLTPYTTNVSIFNSTPARVIPSKLNAIAIDFKNWNNTELGTKGNTHLNTSITNIVEHINTSMDSVTDYINDTMVTNQNNFQVEMETNIGNYLDPTNTGYSVAQSNSLHFTGDCSLTLNVDGLVETAITGEITTYDIIYDVDERVISFKEKILIDSVTYTKSYTVTYNSEDNPTITEV